MICPACSAMAFIQQAARQLWPKSSLFLYYIVASKSPATSFLLVGINVNVKGKLTRAFLSRVWDGHWKQNISTVEQWSF